MQAVHQGVVIMKWDKDIRWDGVSHKEEITEALLSYITGADLSGTGTGISDRTASASRL